MKAALATRKGLIILKPKGTGWDIEKAHFDGVKVTYVAIDSHSGAVWAGVNHGHWGPKLHVSTDKGKTFKELGAPAFPQVGEHKETLKEFWAFASDSKGRVYVGTDPAALFHSDDQGKTWMLNKSLDKVEGKDRWFGAGTDGTALHSILINPQDDKHIVVGVSVGGVLESRDRGQSWKYINAGLKAYFMPDQDDPVVQDPHLVEMAPTNPQVLWQQNHCGIFMSENSGREWKDLSKSKGVQSPFGWAVVVDEKDAKTAYTIPALSDETRVPVKKKLIVQKTTDGGKSWKVLNKGLPQKYCYDIVYRHAFSKKSKNMIFGSTTGHVYFSNNQGAQWKQLKYQLAPIYALKLF
jgi:photosystem II stability/assembly factor-like uncharacterized protein